MRANWHTSSAPTARGTGATARINADLEYLPLFLEMEIEDFFILGPDAPASQGDPLGVLAGSVGNPDFLPTHPRTADEFDHVPVARGPCGVFPRRDQS